MKHFQVVLQKQVGLIKEKFVMTNFYVLSFNNPTYTYFRTGK